MLPLRCHADIFRPPPPFSPAPRRRLLLSAEMPPRRRAIRRRHFDAEELPAAPLLRFRRCRRRHADGCRCRHAGFAAAYAAMLILPMIAPFFIISPVTLMPMLIPPLFSATPPFRFRYAAATICRQRAVDFRHYRHAATPRYAAATPAYATAPPYVFH